jgi:hypothetical protein
VNDATSWHTSQFSNFPSNVSRKKSKQPPHTMNKLTDGDESTVPKEKEEFYENKHKVKDIDVGLRVISPCTSK